MHQPTGRDQILDAVFVIGRTNRFRPLGQGLKEGRRVGRHLGTQLLIRLEQNLLLDGQRRIRLLDGDRKPLQKRFVQQVRPDKAPIVRTATLSVRGRKHRESRLRRNSDAELLDRQRAPFEHRLQAHHLGRGQINLIDRDGAAAKHRDGNRSQFEHRLAVLQTKPADQIILIRLKSDVDADMLHPFECARLLDLKGLAVTRQTGDEHGMKLLRLDNLPNDLELTKGHKRRVLLRNPCECRRLQHQRIDTLENVGGAARLIDGERQTGRRVTHGVGLCDRRSDHLRTLTRSRNPNVG